MIKTFAFNPIDARMYILLEKHSALIVDPCVSDEALSYMQENDVEDVLVILTHEHYDHISGVNWLREQFHKTQVLCSLTCGELIQNSKKNMSAYSEVLLMMREGMGAPSEYGWDENYTCNADQTFEDEFLMKWEGHDLYLKETPGHSKGSICVILDEKYLFSGDSLVTGYPTITRFPGGSTKKFQQITVPYLKSLSGDLMVMPGHGDMKRLQDYPLYVES